MYVTFGRFLRNYMNWVKQPGGDACASGTAMHMSFQPAAISLMLCLVLCGPLENGGVSFARPAACETHDQRSLLVHSKMMWTILASLTTKSGAHEVFLGHQLGLLGLITCACSDCFQLIRQAEEAMACSQPCCLPAGLDVLHTGPRKAGAQESSGSLPQAAHLPKRCRVQRGSGECHCPSTSCTYLPNPVPSIAPFLFMVGQYVVAAAGHI